MAPLRLALELVGSQRWAAVRLTLRDVRGEQVLDQRAELGVSQRRAERAVQDLAAEIREAATGGDVGMAQRIESAAPPGEVMLSESQERMLLVAEKGREQEVIRSVFAGYSTKEISARDRKSVV